MSNTAQTTSEPKPPALALQLVSAQEPSRLLMVEHDDFTIGSGARCDLSLAKEQLHRLHSILHVQGSAIWVEAAHPDAMIVVNDEVFRWRALRDGDRLTFDDVETIVHIGETSIEAAQLQIAAEWQQRQSLDNLALLSAEELCDRIEEEELRVAEFDRGRRIGWNALMAAMAEVIQRGESLLPADSASVPLTVGMPDQELRDLASQVRHLSETLDERNRTLAAQEALLLESSAQLNETQHRVSRQLDQLLERMAPSDDHPGELRVSA